MPYSTITEIPSAVTAFGGGNVTLRFIRPDDEAALRAAFARLSRESRYARFRGLSTLSDEQWRYLAQVDGVNHVALVAVTRTGEIVGVARFVRLERCGSRAEIALTIADDYQRRGLGHTLLDALLPLARKSGVDSFVAYTAACNFAMARLFSAHGGRCVSTGGGEAVLVMDTAARANDDAA